MSIKEEIQKNILFYRKNAKLSQKELAKLLDVNHTAISNWENGHNSIDIETLKKFSEIVGIPLTTIFGENTNLAATPNYSPDTIEVADAYAALPDDNAKNMIRGALGLSVLKKGR